MKILIVDDNLQMREMTHKFLQDVADEIRECEDGSEALAALRRFSTRLGFDGLGNEGNGRADGNTADY